MPLRFVIALLALPPGGERLLPAVTGVGAVRVGAGAGRRAAGAVRGHARRLLNVYLVRDLRQRRLPLPERPEPLAGELGPAARRLVPHDREVRAAAEVLRDGDRRVQVEDDVPPAARDEDRLARLLEDLHRPAVAGPRRVLRSGVYHIEPGYRLVLLLAAGHHGDF